MTITNIRSYQPGIGRVDDPLTLADAEYYHTDMLGSTRIMTDSAGYGIPDSEAAYTAFGEVVPGSGTYRFGYAGAHGYQAPTSDPPGDPYATDFPFLHVGARYYDPTTGRFLQRDPIGIIGGLNAYSYVKNSPNGSVDPSGLRLDSPNGEPFLPDIDGHGLPTGPSFLLCDPWGHCEGEEGFVCPWSEEETLRRFLGERE